MDPEEFSEYFDEPSEYGDPDAIACANGDYNTWEENQVFLDHEGDDHDHGQEDDRYDMGED